MSSKKLYFYTDGACSGNPGPGGYAWFGVTSKSLPINKYLLAEGGGTSDHYTTNNEMELSGVHACLQHILNTYRESGSGYTIYLYCDSRYSVDGYNEWLSSWRRNQWATAGNRPIKNMELWRRIDALKSRLNYVKVLWTRGHSDDPHNTYVDRLAVKFRNLGRRL